MINKTKLGWITSKNNINSDFYDLDETIKLLTEDNYYLSLLGKAKNRTLLKNNTKLYTSIYKWTTELDNFNKNSNKFSIRILFLVKSGGDINKIKCNTCLNSFTSFNYDKGYFNENCITCFNTKNIKYPTIGWFKEKYKGDWEYFYILDRNKIKNKKVGSRDWYIAKYGAGEGLVKFLNITKGRVDTIANSKVNKCSKISQELFWFIYKELTEEEKNNCNFKELNHEVLVEYNNLNFFIDFKCGNKIIEYDGKYWHKDRELIDSLRDKTYIKNNFKLLKLNENDYSRSNKNRETINKCLLFIRDEH